MPTDPKPAKSHAEFSGHRRISLKRIPAIDPFTRQGRAETTLLFGSIVSAHTKSARACLQRSRRGGPPTFVLAVGKIKSLGYPPFFWSHHLHSSMMLLMRSVQFLRS